MNDKNTDKKSTGRRAGRRRYIITVLIALAIILLAVKTSHRKDRSQDEEPLYTVKRGPLNITLTEAGRIKNRDEIVIKNESDRSLKILSLLDEGTVVTNGQLILELESDLLETAYDSAVLNVERVKSDLTAELEKREILKSQKQTDVDRARLDLKFSRLELEKTKDGLHPQELEKANADVMIAEENLERAQKDYIWSQKLHEKGFITLKELKADELAQKQAEINLSVAKTSRELLKQYTHPQKIEQLESDVKFNESALDRAERSMKAELAGQMASIIQRQAELDQGTNDVIKARARLDACKVYAPADGMILYETSRGGRHWETRERMEVGATVHPMQSMIRMPTSNIMTAEFSIQEATKPKLQTGIPAVVKVDAVPDETFRGKITKIGILPDSQQSWLNPDLKVYECDVELDTYDTRLKPGMNCSVNIVLEEHDNAVYVPIQCVLQIDEKPTAYVRKNDKTIKRNVQTGLDDNVFVHIISGLEDGEKVLMNPPFDEAEKRNGNRKKPSDKIKNKPETSAKNPKE